VKLFIQTKWHCEKAWDLKWLENKLGDNYFCAQSAVDHASVGGGRPPHFPFAACMKDQPLYIKMYGLWFIRGLQNKVLTLPDGACSIETPALYEDIASYKDWIAANSK